MNKTTKAVYSAARSVCSWVVSGIMALVWMVLNEGFWKQAWEIARKAWRVIVKVRRLQDHLAVVAGAIEDCKWDAEIHADHSWMDPHVWIYASGISLFSELQPMFDALAAVGVEMKMSSESPDSGLRWFDGRTDAGMIVKITGSLGTGAACQTIDTGEMKPVLKFVCPGDADYPTEEVA